MPWDRLTLASFGSLSLSLPRKPPARVMWHTSLDCHGKREGHRVRDEGRVPPALLGWMDERMDISDGRDVRVRMALAVVVGMVRIKKNQTQIPRATGRVR